jgi:hypothetical protein
MFGSLKDFLLRSSLPSTSPAAKASWLATSEILALRSQCHKSYYQLKPRAMGSDKLQSHLPASPKLRAKLDAFCAMSGDQPATFLSG